MEKYIPDIYQKSIYEINYTKLFKHGIKCVFFDVDNTLVLYKSNTIDQSLKDLIDKIKKIGIKPIIYTKKKKRLKVFTDALEVEGYFDLDDVFYEKDGLLNKYKESEIAIVGDEMLVDIEYGNKIGITTILVNPLSNKDSFISKLRRNREKFIISKLRNNNLFVKGRYYE